MNTISFVQVNFQQGPQELKAYFLPYSAGVILAYAFADKNIKQNWILDQIIWRRDSIESTAQKLKNNTIVAFSTYVWNREYNYALARRIKQLNPDCKLIFGGPEPAVQDPELFKKNNFIDLVINLEGEVTFKRVLEAWGDDLTHIPGLIINNNGQAVNTGMPVRIDNLDILPSPYLTGIFDQIVNDNPDITWNATLETNRGCPYQCTFCDWGSLTYNKVKKFNLDRVFKELEWIGENCGFVMFTDANFGIFPERDNQIVDKLLEVRHRWNRLKNYNITWAKDQKEEVVKIVLKLINYGKVANPGLTVSVQSLDTNVLDNIKRKNLNQHKIEKIFDFCELHGVPVDTELILGLPGETAETWKNNFWKLFRAGNHTGISMVQAQLLENAEMNLTQKHLWKMTSRPFYSYISGSYDNSEIEESIEVVTSTKDIDSSTMLDLLTWNSFIQTFHINGITTYIARFMARNGVDYQEFYDKFYQYLQQDPWWIKELQTTRTLNQIWLATGRVQHSSISGVEVPGWNLHNRITLNLQSQNLIQTTYDLVKKFMIEYYPIPMLEQLIKFQKSAVIDYVTLKSLPLTVDFDYDFWGHLVNNTELNQSCTYQFDTFEDKHMSLQMFLENFWFGRKRNFGKAKITNISNAYQLK